MQLDTRIPLAAVGRQPIRFAPESPIESLTAVAPAINALRGVQQQAETVRQRQAMQALQNQTRQILGRPDATVKDLADVLYAYGSTPEHFDAANKLTQAYLQDQNTRKEMGQFFPSIAGGEAPRNALAQPAAMPAGSEMPAGAAPDMPAAPSAEPSFGGVTQSQALRAAAMGTGRVAELGKTVLGKMQTGDKDEVRSRMRAMNLPETQEGFAQYFRITQPQLEIGEKRLELEKQRAEMDRLRFQASQAKSEADARTAQHNLALAERRYELSVRQFELTSDPSYQARLAAVKTAASETAKSDVAALSEAPVAIEQGQRALALLNRMVGNPKGRGAEAQPHPGFQGVVGATFVPGARLVQGTAEADFDAMLEQVLGGAFLEAYERLKGTGQVTEIEGKKATQAISRMGRAVSEAEFMQAAQEFRSALETAMERTSTRLERARTRTELPVPQAGTRPPAVTTPTGAATAAPPTGRTFPTPPQAAIDALKRGQGTDAQFDAIFGPGAAAKARGR